MADIFKSLLGGSESSGTSRSFVDPNQRRFLDMLFSGAEGFLNAPRSDMFNQALTQFGEQGLNNPLLGAAQNDILGTLSGGISPALQSQLNASDRQITPQVDSRFNQSGRFGSGLHKIGLGRSLADSRANLIGGERARALSAAPGIANQQFGNLMQLLNFDPNFQNLARFKSLIGPPTVLSESQNSSSSANGGLLDLIGGGMFLGQAGPFAKALAGG